MKKFVQLKTFVYHGHFQIIPSLGPENMVGWFQQEQDEATVTALWSTASLSEVRCILIQDLLGKKKKKKEQDNFQGYMYK